MSAADALFLDAAISLAEGGRYTCAPNPPVGCVIVKQGRIIGRGFHVRPGEGHAEVNAIADAGGKVRGATVYVSLEPCAFEGRTPACAHTLVEQGVARVVVATLDPHPRVAGEGMEILRRAGIEAEVNEVPAARQTIAGYVSRVTRGRPIVRIKSASSLDGAISLADGTSRWISGAQARADVQRWRARADAVVTGIGTVLADDPQLNVRDAELGEVTQPLRVILDTALRTPADAKLVTDAGATLLVHGAAVDVPPELAAAAHVELAEAPADLGALLAMLGDRGCNEVLVEAGPKVVGSFVDAGLWDEWIAYVAPKWLGTSAVTLADFELKHLADAPAGEIREIIRFGQDVRLTIVPAATDA